jgi:hypothetical protein
MEKAPETWDNDDRACGLGQLNANSVHQEKSVSAGVMSPDFLLFHAVDIGPGSYQQCRL